MTRQRVYGSDTAFCAWMRRCNELPSSSDGFGLSATDNDVTIHRYKTVVDGIGTREIQGLMQIEVKTRRGVPSGSQCDTLSKLNLFKDQLTVSGETIRFFGVFVLAMDGVCPDTSSVMWWGSMKAKRIVKRSQDWKWKQINRETLIELMRFDIDPYNFSKNPFRRHHKTREVMVRKVSPLGFEYDEIVVKRS